MLLNQADKCFCKDAKLQNCTKTEGKGVIGPSRF